MKKYIFPVFALFMALNAAGQTLESNRVFTLHVIKVQLNPGITTEEFSDFMNREFLPAWEKHYQGIEAILVRAIRGRNESEFGWINYYDSVEELQKFYPEAGKKSDLAREAEEKMKPMEEKLARYGKMRYAGYTTWLVQ